MPESVTVTYARGPVSLSAITSIADDYGWFRNRSNTGLSAVGLSASDLTKYTGPLDVPTGTRIYRKSITLGNNQLLLSSNVQIVECLITGSRIGSQGQIRLKDGTSGQSVTNTDLILTGTGGEIAGIYAANANGVKIDSLYETGGSIGLWLDTVDGAASSTISKWWYGAQPTPGGAHRDGFTRRLGSVPISIDSSRIEIINNSATGAIFTQPTWGGTAGAVTVRNSYLLGGGYVVGLDRGYDSHFFNNRYTPTGWGPTGISKSAYKGPWDWVDQYYYDEKKSDYRGASIPSPI